MHLTNFCMITCYFEIGCFLRCANVIKACARYPSRSRDENRARIIVAHAMLMQLMIFKLSNFSFDCYAKKKCSGAIKYYRLKSFL